MALSNPDRPIDWAEIVTFEAAEELNPYEVARHWSDPMCWRLERTARDQLGELACMAALGRWLDRWQPISIHRALKAGASVGEVAAAVGGSVEETGRAWYQWADGQRRWGTGGKLGITAEEYATVAAILTAVGVTPPDPAAGQ